MTPDNKELLQRRILELYSEAMGNCYNGSGAFGMGFDLFAPIRMERVQKIKDDLDTLVNEL